MRTSIVATARSYLGSPYQHQGRIKGKAIDCLGLVLCVAEELGLRDKHGIPLRRSDYLNYSPSRADSFIQRECERRLILMPLNEAQPGDVVTIRLASRAITHIGFLTDIGFIHAYQGGGHNVFEHRIDARWQRRIAGAFSFPGVS